MVTNDNVDDVQMYLGTSE